MNKYYVYILASRRKGTLYVGMAGDITKRVVRQKEGQGSKFVQKYDVHRLVYFEKVSSYRKARVREKELKHYTLQRE
jgi:putative endonuclease